MNDQINTLVILIPGFPKDETDLNCLPLHQSFIRAFKEKFPSLKIIVLSFDYPYFKKRYSWNGVEVISFNGRNKGGLQKLLLWNKIKKQLDNVNSSNRVIGLLSMWLGTCARVGKKFADKHDLKHYCWLLGQDAKPGNKYVRRLNLRTDELIALSDFLQDEFEKNYGIRPQHVVPPGIDTRQFRKDIQQRDIDILGAGSLIPLKQYEIFINVVAEIKKQFPNIKAVLIGDGPEKQKLQSQIALAGLQSNVTLTGELPHPDVLQWMQRGKLLLHPSSYEGFVVVCLEALCAGAEVISFVKPMHTEIQNWRTVVNKEEMIQKAIEILKTPKTEYKSIIPYRIEQTAQKMAQLFSL